MKVKCHICYDSILVTKAGKYRVHAGCDASGTLVPDNLYDAGELPPSAPSSHTPTDTASSAICSPTSVTGDPQSAESPSTTSSPTKTDAVTLPGVEEYAEAMQKAKPAPFFSQPASPFSQPAKNARVMTQAKPMTELGKRVTSELKQMFFQYNNRKSDDNRSAQAHLGPSEIGTDCDRRLAMSLLRVDPVNPGGDSWAAFVGTCVHAGLAEMFQWADGDTGRYAVEVPLKFPSLLVPRGTGDLLDRTLLLFIDHKAMGQWSLDKLKTDGPSNTYRVQVHTYAYGARIRGDMVNSVGIVGWPRDKGSLDDLYVWTEDYNPAIARDALERVDRIAARAKELSQPLHPDGQWSALNPLEVAAEFPFDKSDCKYCPFHMPGAKALKEGGVGCNGRA